MIDEECKNHVLLLDIDGVVCHPQEPMSPEMAQKINLIHYKTHGNVYFVTGNTYTKAVDLVGGGKIFCNNADELREDGRLLWRDEVTPPLPVIHELNLLRAEYNSPNNKIEWRGPRFANVCPLGRFATKEQRDNHDASWRERWIKGVMHDHPEIEASIGGQVSVDIYSKGADKSRAAKYINDLGKPFIFIGDKTTPVGNDYPIIKYCETSEIKNVCLTTDGPETTMKYLDKFFSLIR